MTIAAAARWALLAFTATALIGCGSARDAASEEPVAVTPGFYTITLNGQVGGFTMPSQSGSNEPDGAYCVMEGQQADFPRRVALALAVHPGCSAQQHERTGNLVTGGWRCPTDPERAPGGSWDIAYTGTVAAEEVELTGRMSIDFPENLPGMTPEQRQQLAQGEAMMENIDIGVRAVRTGDCG